MTRAVSRVLGCALVMAFAATLLAAAPSSAGPGYHQPKAGSCHQVTLRQFASIVAPTASVPCTEQHSTKTLVVKRLSGKVDWNDKYLMRPIWATCLRKMHRALGGNDKSRAMSAFEPSFFIPSPSERAHGARWLRCDVGLVGDRKLQQLPARLDIGSPPLEDDVARCYNGPDRRLSLTVCSKQHRYRATGGFRFGSRKYPGESALTKAAVKRCPPLVTSKHWRYSIPPGPAEWRLGQRTIVCYSKTTQ